MDTDVTDNELVARLKRLDGNAAPEVSFGYDALIDRHAAKQARARRRLGVARFDQPIDELVVESADVPEEKSPASQPRIVRADTYLALAALEDHIATLDDARNVARLRGGSAEVARLERTRAELFDSYTQVRYAELVSANF